MKLDEFVRELDGFLRIADFKDYPNALNGLQVENSGNVSRIGAAVDACESVLLQAAAARVDLLLVHHGLFWGGLAPLTGALGRKARLCFEKDIALYSAHLPLDAQPELGNNALLCAALGLAGERKPFLDIGWQVEDDISRDLLRQRLEAAVGGPVHLAPGGPGTSRRIGIVTGGAGDAIFKAAAAGVDTFITGEGSHWTYTAAEETGVNLFYAGHYATETFGVKALASHLAGKYSLPWEFFDHPTGL